MEISEKINILNNNIIELQNTINIYHKYLHKLKSGQNINFIPSSDSYKDYQKSFYFNVIKPKKLQNKKIDEPIKKISKYFNFDDNFIIDFTF